MANDLTKQRVLKLIKETRNYATVIQDQSPPLAEALMKSALWAEDNIECLNEIGLRYEEGKLVGLTYAAAAYLNGVKAAVI